MRDTLGDRPFEISQYGDKITLKFYPITKNAKNPDMVLFRLTMSKADLKKLIKQVE